MSNEDNIFCNLCKISLPKSSFSKRDGSTYRKQCKSCRSLKAKLARDNDLETSRARGRASYLKNKDNPLRKENSKISSKAFLMTKNGKFITYRANANRRRIEFSLTLDDFCRLWQRDCTYCGKCIDTIGIDRIDNSLGYISGNVMPCCYDCNVMKKSIIID